MAGRGGWKKRRPPCNEADRSSSLTPRESELTSIWSFVTREFDQPMEKAKQMRAELSTTAGAAFHEAVDWHATDWHAAHHTVNRLQARIVKATQERGCETASRNGRLKGLSCMKGNCHVQFLGGGAAATPPCYPAGGRVTVLPTATAA